MEQSQTHRKCDKNLRDGRPCTFNAIYIVNYVYYCGVHIRQLKLSDEEKEEFKILSPSQLQAQANIPPPLFSTSYTSALATSTLSSSPAHNSAPIPTPIITSVKRRTSKESRKNKDKRSEKSGGDEDRDEENNEDATDTETEIGLVNDGEDGGRDGNGGGSGGGRVEEDNDDSPSRTSVPVPVPAPKKRAPTKRAPRAKAKPGESNDTEKKCLKPLEKLFLNIYASIITHIEEGTFPEEITDDAISLIREMNESSEGCKIDLITEATRRAGTRESIQRIMPYLTNVILEYNQAMAEQRMNPSIQHHQYDYMEPIKVEIKERQKIPDDNGTYQLTETGNAIYFPGVDMTIINCNPHILQSYGYASFEEWTSKSTSVFMFNNEWYIPAKEDFPFRAKQNIEDAKEILENMDDEREEKYLQLMGKTLGCFCSPANCHCEVYVLVVCALKGIQANSLSSTE